MTSSSALPAVPAPAPAPLFGWPRLRVTLIISLLLSLLIGLGSATPMLVWLVRGLVVGC